MAEGSMFLSTVCCCRKHPQNIAYSFLLLTWSWMEFNILSHHYLKWAMQQHFTPLNHSSLSPPHLYTLLKEIRFQRVNFHANTAVHTTVLDILNSVKFLSCFSAITPCNCVLYSCTALWNSESNVCSLHEANVLLVLGAYDRNLKAIPYAGFFFSPPPIKYHCDCTNTVPMWYQCSRQWLTSHRDIKNTLPITLKHFNTNI